MEKDRRTSNIQHRSASARAIIPPTSVVPCGTWVFLTLNPPLKRWPIFMMSLRDVGRLALLELTGCSAGRRTLHARGVCSPNTISSLRDLGFPDAKPTVKTVGYFHDVPSGHVAPGGALRGESHGCRHCRTSALGVRTRQGSEAGALPMPTAKCRRLATGMAQRARPYQESAKCARRLTGRGWQGGGF